MSPPTPFYPERVPIDAYGDNGFRFAGASHRGSLLILPDGVYGWDPVSAADFEPGVFSQVFHQSENIDFLLLGTGKTLLAPPGDIVKAFVEAGVGLEFMDTGAACRTFNVLLGEERAVAAALLAVD